ncbi:hypothetical protein IGI04_031869 [Brassica rapa subsp. trilocularis]|uniref:Uncharacterized protein n=1 Tax=Brassica rapa subsp. trilocularis TaxID=1813537 RepID=A0ABQ7LXC3_BRACM|nr:hypothetical protein IGI04_031869 [Brassica rapa subsp. trilocularis]
MSMRSSHNTQGWRRCKRLSMILRTYVYMCTLHTMLIWFAVELYIDFTLVRRVLMFATDCATYGWFWRRCKRLSVIHREDKEDGWGEFDSEYFDHKVANMVELLKDEHKFRNT